jgi:hypothetical protein
MGQNFRYVKVVRKSPSCRQNVSERSGSIGPYLIPTAFSTSPHAATLKREKTLSEDGAESVSAERPDAMTDLTRDSINLPRAHLHEEVSGKSRQTRHRVMRLALTRSEAAEAIGMSVDSFERYVQPELKIVRVGRMRLIQVRELERWLQENAARVLEEPE